MQIRRATEDDIPSIISLLKLSLGESLMPKTEKFWRWKHLENPFGESIILVAIDGGVLVGLRAFMLWQWACGRKIYNSVRAVDTATHPDYQGKGIFKTLTMQGLDEVKSLGVNFVFNTPNHMSKPGYLKMGWKEQGRMALKIKINPIAYNKKMVDTVSDWSDILLNTQFYSYSSQGFHTNYSLEYINWRYGRNPIFKYHYLTDQNSYFFIYRYKQHSFGVELRIVDFFIDDRSFDHSKSKELAKKLTRISERVFLTSVSGNHYRIMQRYYPGLGIIPEINKGPMVTLRNVNLSEVNFNELLTPRNWEYSLGDLELF